MCTLFFPANHGKHLDYSYSLISPGLQDPIPAVIVVIDEDYSQKSAVKIIETSFHDLDSGQETFPDAGHSRFFLSVPEEGK